MLVCVECEHLFEEPVWWVETHGLDAPPYERRYGCPKCYGAYIKARKCDNCGEFITSTYVKTENGKRFCENCYDTYELGEED